MPFFFNNAIFSNIGGPRGSHTEQSNSDREREISYDIPYMWNFKRYNTDELTKQRLTDLENELMVARGKAQLGSLAWTCTQCYI